MNNTAADLLDEIFMPQAFHHSEILFNDSYTRIVSSSTSSIFVSISQMQKSSANDAEAEEVQSGNKNCKK